MGAEPRQAHAATSELGASDEEECVRALRLPYRAPNPQNVDASDEGEPGQRWAWQYPPRRRRGFQTLKADLNDNLGNPIGQGWLMLPISQAVDQGLSGAARKEGG